MNSPDSGNASESTASQPPRQHPKPRTVRLSFHVILEDHTTTLLELNNTLDFSVPAKATPLALLGEQVKSIFMVMAHQPLITEVNSYVQKKLEGTRTSDHEPSPALPVMNGFKDVFGVNPGTEETAAQSDDGLNFVI